MALPPETIYTQLGFLIANRPELEGRGEYGSEQHEWLGRISALIEAARSPLDTASAQMAVNLMADPSTRRRGYAQLMILLHAVLAKTELLAPPSTRGAFINVGQSFSALQAVGKVLSSASGDILVIDPYLNLQALFDFAPMARDGVKIRLLCDSNYPSLNNELRTGFGRWTQQYGTTKPLEVRCTAPKMLHDRLIIIDSRDAWVLTQSLKDMAVRAPASLVKADTETAQMKVQAYANIWAGSQQL